MVPNLPFSSKPVEKILSHSFSDSASAIFVHYKELAYGIVGVLINDKVIIYKSKSCKDAI
jgi:hypothetical protein